MERLLKTRNYIIIILCLTIVSLGIGFALISMQLNNNKNNKPHFSVDFIKTEPRTPVQGGNIAPTVATSITNSNQTINLEFNLYAPRDEIGSKIIIKNTGNIPAEIINLLEKPDYLTDSAAIASISPVKITHNNIIGKVLQPNEELELNIIATFDFNSQPINIKVPYQLSIIAKSIKK